MNQTVGILHEIYTGWTLEIRLRKLGVSKVITILTEEGKLYFF